ncbi:MAG: DNA polymerase I [Oscillospiraceae bacterium]|jgi:DNA polymerase-1|nr:DNA polymerase I [Oscillospiraceae bacterium]
MKLLALDGNSILNRAFYGIRLLSTKEGIFTNGIYGFLTMLQKIKDDVQPDTVAIAFDMRAPTFRHKAYDGYKANRKGMPEELAVQMPILQELLEYMGYPILKLEGWEADDILGTLAEMCCKSGDECIIATGDRDTLQLVSDCVSVRLLTTKNGSPEATLYDIPAIKEKYGVEPPQLIDIKAIQGDASDNIPGVKGIGEKGAGELIGKFGSLQYIYDNLEELDIKEGVRNKLLESKENAFLSYMLGTVRRDAPLGLEISGLTQKEPERQKMLALMSKLELFSIIKKLGLSAAELPNPQAQEGASFSYEKEADSFTILMAVSQESRVFLLPDYTSTEPTAYLTIKDCVHRLEEPAIIKSILENPELQICTHDIKTLHSFVAEHGISIAKAGFDTLLAAYLINPNAGDYQIERLCAEYGIALPYMEEGTEAAVIRAAALPALTEALERKIKAYEMESLLQDIELPLAEVLSFMERVGIRVDSRGIAVFGKQLELQIKELEKRIIEAAGVAFNINSPKQLGKVLFEDMALRPVKKTKTGYSTSAEVLEELKYEHEIVRDVLEYRQLAKLKSTYCDGLLKVVGEDGRIHSTFNQTETRTGRISSAEPNLQNIPVRTELGSEMRKFFIAEEGYTLCDADYSQIELRVLAHAAADPVMISSFNMGEDIHRITAAQVFHMPPELVTPQMRSSAKAVNFGIVYGIGAFSLGKDIGVTTHEASQFIKAYMQNFTGVQSYMEHTVADAKERGYAETMFGRRRPLTEISSSNGNIRAFGERVARNMPIQGAAADIIKIAMVRVYQRIKEEGLRARLILQVHDELIVEAPKEEAEQASIILSQEMQNAAKLAVPLLAEVHEGRTWYDAKG